ncbi:hypothetical protein ACFQ2B_05470 [Streptomyces stramineus]
MPYPGAPHGGEDVGKVLEPRWRAASSPCRSRICSSMGATSAMCAALGLAPANTSPDASTSMSLSSSSRRRARSISGRGAPNSWAAWSTCRPLRRRDQA